MLIDAPHDPAPRDPSPHERWASPRWRWDRARYLASHRRPRRRPYDDEWVVTAAAFLRAVARDGPVRAAARWPDLALARDIDVGTPARRWQVEARLLAGEPADRIAEKCNTTGVAIVAYEAMFFGVADKLDAPDYIALMIIRRDPAKALADQGSRVLLHVVGYLAGQPLLDALLGGVDDAATRASLDRLLAEDALATARRNLAVAARALPTDAEVATKLAGLLGPPSPNEADDTTARPGGSAELIREQVDVARPADRSQARPKATPPQVA